MLNDCDGHFRRTLVTVTFVALSTLVIVGCKKSDTTDSTKGSAAPAPATDKAPPADKVAAPAEAPADPQMLAAAQAALDAAYKGTDREPPKTASKPAKGKKVWIISPGQIGESASIPTKAAKEAGELLGWDMTIYDSKLDVASFSTGVRQAIAAKADGVILDAIDCPLVKQALTEAKAAKVKIVGYYAFDCDDPNVKGTPMFDASVNFGAQLGNYSALTKAWAAAKADWVITKTKGHAKVIEFKEDELLVVKYIREGFEEELAKCKTCQIVQTVDFTLSDLGPKLQQKAQTALLQHPEANAIHVPYDSAVLLGISAAVFESGRNDQIDLIGGEAFPTNLALIRANKGEDAANAFPAEWTGYASVDTMNSLFNGQPIQDSGIGFRVIDRDHNLPASGGYVPSADFKAAYKKAWGVAL